MFRAHLFGGPARGQVLTLDCHPGGTLLVAPRIEVDLDEPGRNEPIPPIAHLYEMAGARERDAGAYLWAGRHWSQSERDQLADLVAELRGIDATARPRG